MNLVDGEWVVLRLRRSCEAGLTLWRSLRDNTFPTWNGTGAGRRDPNWKMSVESSISACMLPLHEMTNHFSVTCPFWTRFMLKPTVGIELKGLSAIRPSCSIHMVSSTQ
jgi:hypothetical protein